MGGQVNGNPIAGDRTMGTVDADRAKFDHRHASADFLAALGLQVSVSVTKVSPVAASMVA
jgi:hypothetical protein